MNTKKAILKNLSLFLTSKKSNNKNVPIVLYEKLKNIEIAKIVRISLFHHLEDTDKTTDPPLLSNLYS